MRNPHDLTQWVSRKYAAGFRKWLGLEDMGAGLVFSFPLQLPTEAKALAEMDAVKTWITQWSKFPTHSRVEVHRSHRQWVSLGRQMIPQKVVITGVEALAAMAGQSSHWLRLTSNFRYLSSELGSVGSASSSIAAQLAVMNDTDLHHLVESVHWLIDHPDSQRLMREVPIMGADTKWLETHLGLVKPLVQALTGREDLGLRKDPRRFRVKVLDPSMNLGWRDNSMSAADWATQPISVRIVFITENLQPLLRLDEIPGAIAIHGLGKDVTELANIGWIAEAKVYYWGDLDSHGFKILEMVRRQWTHAESILMDIDTLRRHWDSGVVEPSPYRAPIGYLTASEYEALHALQECDWRLEQEKIPWDEALGVLVATLH